jgi:hypothetical protein
VVLVYSVRVSTVLVEMQELEAVVDQAAQLAQQME